MDIKIDKPLNLEKGDSPGNMKFVIDGNVLLELCGNGDIMVKGKLATTDIEVVDAMREFLKRARV
jgi:hypothetical protein